MLVGTGQATVDHPRLLNKEVPEWFQSILNLVLLTLKSGKIFLT
jgi:hypothetical protein